MLDNSWVKICKIANVSDEHVFNIVHEPLFGYEKAINMICSVCTESKNRKCLDMFWGIMWPSWNMDPYLHSKNSHNEKTVKRVDIVWWICSNKKKNQFKQTEKFMTIIFWDSNSIIFINYLDRAKRSQDSITCFYWMNLIVNWWKRDLI